MIINSSCLTFKKVVWKKCRNDWQNYSRNCSCYYCIIVFSQIITGYSVLGSIALILFITSVISFCPMYSLFGHSSSRDKQSKRNFSLWKNSQQRLNLKRTSRITENYLANQTTVLAFFRTAMYFFGLSTRIENWKQHSNRSIVLSYCIRYFNSGHCKFLQAWLLKKWKNTLEIIN
jgi:hypothetical protein